MAYLANATHGKPRVEATRSIFGGGEGGSGPGGRNGVRRQADGGLEVRERERQGLGAAGGKSHPWAVLKNGKKWGIKIGAAGGWGGGWKKTILLTRRGWVLGGGVKGVRGTGVRQLLEKW